MKMENGGFFSCFIWAQFERDEVKIDFTNTVQMMLHDGKINLMRLGYNREEIEDIAKEFAKFEELNTEFVKMWKAYEGSWKNIYGLELGWLKRQACDQRRCPYYLERLVNEG
jgi:hypothetical protein